MNTPSEVLKLFWLNLGVPSKILATGEKLVKYDHPKLPAGSYNQFVINKDWILKLEGSLRKKPTGIAYKSGFPTKAFPHYQILFFLEDRVGEDVNEIDSIVRAAGYSK